MEKLKYVLGIIFQKMENYLYLQMIRASTTHLNVLLKGMRLVLSVAIWIWPGNKLVKTVYYLIEQSQSYLPEFKTQITSAKNGIVINVNNDTCCC